MRSFAERAEADLLKKVGEADVLRPGEVATAALPAWTDARGPTVTGAAVVGGVLGGAIGGAIGGALSERKRRREAGASSAPPRMLAMVLTNERLLLFRTLRGRKKELHEEIALARIGDVSVEPHRRLGLDASACVSFRLLDKPETRSYWIKGHVQAGIRFADALRSAVMSTTPWNH